MATLSEYYKKLINIWKNGGNNGGSGGWAGLYYGIFDKVIKDNNFKVVAEVGIGYGFHAKQILDNTNVDKLYLIDPMQFYPNDGFATDVLSNGGFETLVQNIKTHLKDHETRYEWFRQPSITIDNNQIPDESLDAIFIDADHSYDAVSKDLPFWWKKLKKGGWLLGDDYIVHHGTKEAVNEFASLNKLKLDFLYQPNNSYPIYKFVK